jgi:hypothetical protein
MPLICPGGFDTCTPNLAGRKRLRMVNTDGNLFAVPQRNVTNLVSPAEMHPPGISPSHSTTAFALKQPRRDVPVLSGLPFHKATRRSSHSILQMTFPAPSKAEIWPSIPMQELLLLVAFGARGMLPNCLFANSFER